MDRLACNAALVSAVPAKQDLCQNPGGYYQASRVLEPCNLAPLDAELLDPVTGRVRVKPAAAVLAIPSNDLSFWALKRARYGLVTEELIAFLRVLLGVRLGREGLHDTRPFTPNEAIEIAAGMGDLGGALGVHMTDSAVQTSREMRQLYGSLGQAVVDPPKDVERLDALAAVRKHRPSIVITSWCTQLYKPGDTHASVYGVDEEWLLSKESPVELYIHIGHDDSHGTKRILALPHEEVRADWLVSRSTDQTKNAIWMWQKRA